MTGPIAVQVVYVARNPKDVIVSYYFHHKLIKLQGYTGDMEQFAQFFMDDERIYTYTSNEQLVIYINKICLKLKRKTSLPTILTSSSRSQMMTMMMKRNSRNFTRRKGFSRTIASHSLLNLR